MPVTNEFPTRICQATLPGHDATALLSSKISEEWRLFAMLALELPPEELKASIPLAFPSALLWEDPT